MIDSGNTIAIHFQETYLEPTGTSKMERFCKNG